MLAAVASVPPVSAKVPKVTNLSAVATFASLAAAVPKLKSITAPPTPVMLICSLVSVVLLS